MSKVQLASELANKKGKKKNTSKKRKLNPIIVGDGDKKIIKNEFDTTYYTVRKALSGNTTTLLGYKIRRFAKSIGGQEFPDDKPL